MNVPVVLPVVAVDVDTSGELTIRLDDQPYPAPGQLRRSDLRAVLDDITRALGTPVRVHVVESDGTTYADITTPPDPSTTKRTPLTSTPLSAARSALPSSAVPMSDAGGPHAEHPVVSARLAASGVHGVGFRPGERVAVAYVLGHDTADHTGTAALRLPPAVLARHQASLILLGLDSHTHTPLTAVAETPDPTLLGPS